jgi:hypothetical protein
MAHPPERLAAELERKLAALREARMQARLLREQLEALDAGELYALLAHVLRRTAASDRPADALREQLEALLIPGGGPLALPYELRAGVYAQASGARDTRVMELLRAHEPPAAADDPTQHAHLDLREVPLGRRRSLARGRDPLLLEKLARDPDPVVIANLLANPRTREEDAVRIAALRPVAAGTLHEIARSPRWGRQPRVRAALAQNPDCPLELALLQLHALARAELRAIASRGALNPVLRAHAQHELTRRSGLP